ncbi:MAG: hypothetical protein K0S64_1481 [Gaiellaceae bacterium]|nr:hypothetical protein [Gaiellaceae bacterium]
MAVDEDAGYDVRRAVPDDHVGYAVDPDGVEQMIPSQG